MIRKLLIVLGLWITYQQTSIFINSIWPEKVEETIVETAESDTATTTIELPEPEPEKPWEPLDFNGDVGTFAKKHGGRVFTIKGSQQESYIKTAYGMKPKVGAIVEGDLYFRYKRKNYVIHQGKLIKI